VFGRNRDVDTIAEDFVLIEDNEECPPTCSAPSHECKITYSD